MSEEKKTDAVRLNLGSGPHPMPGYRNLDIKDGFRIDALPYDDGTVDEIRASHVLEHVSHTVTLDVMRHWFSKLKPGGVCKVAVPNLGYIIGKLGTATDEPLEGYLMGGHCDADDYHKAVFTYEKLDSLFRAAGFDCVRPWDSDFADCSSLPVSLNIQAEKPTGPVDLRHVCVLMSVPRLMFTDNVIPMMATIKELNMPIIANTGAFWGQCLDRIMRNALEDVPGLTHVLTCDYDSIFSVDHVKRLYRTAIRANADAMFAVQVKRQAACALMTIMNEDGTLRQSITQEEARADYLRVSTGHFGLTLIKADAIRRLQSPWFQEVPDASGGWGDGHIDPDIWFWRQWNKSGNTLYQANHVKIGHAQLMATFPDSRWNPVHIHMSEVQKAGIPIFAR